MNKSLAKILGTIVLIVLVSLALRWIIFKGVVSDEVWRNRAWAVFQNYILAARANNLEELRSLSYQLSETCRDESKLEGCKDLMNNAYYFGSQFHIETLKNIVYDKKQIILFGDYAESATTESVSLLRFIIYFVREGGTIKLLSFSPFDGTFTVRSSEATSTQLSGLRDKLRDSDLDTLSDSAEECLNSGMETCTKTNPEKRDTDGDLWWDSTESLFYQK